MTSPEDAKWLQEDERGYIKARLQADQGNNAADRKVTFADVVTVMKDFKVWLGGLMYFGLIVPAYSYAFFSPAIIQTYNYDPIQTQLHSVPPWVASFAFAMLIAFVSDFSRHRFLFAIGSICLAVCAAGVGIPPSKPSRMAKDKRRNPFSHQVFLFWSYLSPSRNCAVQGSCC